DPRDRPRAAVHGQPGAAGLQRVQHLRVARRDHRADHALLDRAGQPGTVRTAMTTTTPTRRAGRWGLSALLPALVLLGLSCSSLTSVDAPDILQPGQVDTPDGANVLRVGGLGTFYYDVILYPYGVPGWAGLLSDE